MSSRKTTCFFIGSCFGTEEAAAISVRYLPIQSAGSAAATRGGDSFIAHARVVTRRRVLHYNGGRPASNSNQATGSALPALAYIRVSTTLARAKIMSRAKYAPGGGIDLTTEMAAMDINLKKYFCSKRIILKLN